MDYPIESRNSVLRTVTTIPEKLVQDRELNAIHSIPDITQAVFLFVSVSSVTNEGAKLPRSEA